MTSNQQKAYFAAGCFWGVEYYFKKLAGVISTTVGYMGGETESPTYEQVSSHTTKHAETIEVTYDTEKVSFENLAKYFFEIHDPTQLNRQGPDIGEQYRSTIFYNNQTEKEISEKLINILKEKGYNVVTTLEPAKTFWPAEEYHQEYYEKNGHTPYCHIYTKKF